MKHARDDYNRIQDPAGLIPDDEPVFLLRAQDQLACMAVEYYAYLCQRFRAPEVAAKAQEHAKLMREWPKKKIPDLPAEAQPQCCGRPEIGGEHMGAQEQVCCGQPEPAEPTAQEYRAQPFTESSRDANQRLCDWKPTS